MLSVCKNCAHNMNPMCEQYNQPIDEMEWVDSTGCSCVDFEPLMADYRTPDRIIEDEHGLRKIGKAIEDVLSKINIEYDHDLMMDHYEEFAELKEKRRTILIELERLNETNEIKGRQ